MELEFLYAIAKVIPDDMEVSIIFENWSKNFPSEDILYQFGNRASLYILRQYPVGDRKQLIYKFIKLLKLLCGLKITCALEDWSKNKMKGDLVLDISKSSI